MWNVKERQLMTKIGKNKGLFKAMNGAVINSLVSLQNVNEWMTDLIQRETLEQMLLKTYLWCLSYFNVY